MGAKVELPVEIKDVWAKQVANSEKEDQLVEELAAFEGKKLTRAEYKSSKDALKKKLRAVRKELKEGEGNLFVVVNNYILVA